MKGTSYLFKKILVIILVTFIYLLKGSWYLYAQGLTVPAGSTVDVGAGTLNVTGNVGIGGTLITSTGTVSLSGNWTNTGTFTANDGTVDFTLASGTQTVDSNGTTAGRRFNNLTHSGAGTLSVQNNALDVDGTFTNSAGIFLTNGNNMTIEGNWSNSATFTHGSNTVTLDGTNQSMFGTTTFSTLIKALSGAGATLIFDSTGEQVITTQLTLTGNGSGNELTLNSDDTVTPTQAKLTLAAAGLQTISDVRVANNDASGTLVTGVTLVARGAASANLGNNTNWSFGSATITWQGDINNSYNTPGNWDLGLVPTSVDTAVIADVTIQPVLDVAATLTNLTVNSGATISLSGFALTVSSTLSNEGTVILQGGEAVSIATPDTDSGLFSYTGTGAGATLAISDIASGTGIDYYDVTFNDTGGSPDTFRTGASANIVTTRNLTVSGGTLDTTTNSGDITVGSAGTFTVDGGTVTATTSDVDVNGNFVLSGGTFTAPGSSNTFNLFGNFTHSNAATFTHSSGTLTLDGTDQSVLGDANTTFNSFVKNVTSTATITFTTSSTQTFASNLTLTGQASNLLLIRSDVNDSAAAISLTSGGTQSISYVDVKDSNASGGIGLVGRNGTNNGGNSGWFFNNATMVWQGDDGTSPTDYDTAANWDLGLVPIAGDTATIPSAPAYPILGSSSQVANVNITDSSATLTLAGNNYTISDTLSNIGTVIIQGGETIAITTPDTDSGTFRIVGDGGGSANLSLSDISASGTDFYTLVINDSAGTPDTIRTTGNLVVANTLNVTGGGLDISNGTDTLTVASTLTVDGGTLTATNGNIDANGAVSITSGTLTAPTTNQSFTAAGSWGHTGGTFTHSSGEVTFDTSATSTFTGDTTFYDFTSTVDAKTFTFTAGTDQTIEGEWLIAGGENDPIIFQSSALNSKWDVTFPNGVQAVQFVTVRDSDANTNVVTCFVCTNGGNNNANWVFRTLAITVPDKNRTIDRTPTIIGIAEANDTVTIRQEDETVIGTTTADSSGNFRLEITDANQMDLGSNRLIPLVGALRGVPVTDLTVATSPTTAQQPTITSHQDGDRLLGATPAFSGKGQVGQTVEVVANDANGNLLLATVGTGTVNSDGDYTVTITTPLPKGTNYVSVTVDEVASDIVEVQLTDPFGVVFDSTSNVPISGATVSLYRNSDGQLATIADGDIDATDTNPLVTGSDGVYSFLTANADYYIRVEASNYEYPSQLDQFPDGRSVVTGSKGEVFTVAGTVIHMDHPMDATNSLLRIEKDANKSEARIGEVVTYTIEIENISSQRIVGVWIEDNIPAGFKYVPNRVMLDDQPIKEPQGQRPLLFYTEIFNPGDTKVLRYQLVIGSGVSFGDHQNSAKARYFNGIVLSNTATETVKVVLDPIFDLGTVIGKVFIDYNQNGIQDPPTYSDLERTTIIEDPIPNVQIAMEDGTVITTDEQGRFSIPGLMPGRHLFRIDERSLPEGSVLTTEKVQVVNITPGLLNKVNFGVNLDYRKATVDDEYFTDSVKLIVDRARPSSWLNIDKFNGAIGVYENSFVEPAEFRIFTNYAPYIEYWRMEILDADTKRKIRTFEGNRYDIHDPIFWDGLNNKGEHIILDNRNYEYRLYVEDQNRQYDETMPAPLEFVRLEDKEQLDEYKKSIGLDVDNTADEPKTRNLVEQYDQQKEKEQKELSRKQTRADQYRNWSREQSGKDMRLVQNILIDGETIRLNPIRARIQSIYIMKDDKLFTEVPIAETRGLTATELMDGLKSAESDEIEIILPKGKFDIVVQDQSAQFVAGDLATVTRRDAADGPSVLMARTGDGRLATSDTEEQPRKIESYVKSVEVGEDYLFFVGMGDAVVGYNFNRGNVEPIRNQDEYQSGFYTKGKMAYYLTGKIKGKYLVTSSFDSEREQKDLFRQIDPDKYYPVYGDSSEINYNATNTQGNLYLMMEWDKSSAQWGNYDVNFSDTEFARFSRSLYGGKVDFQSLSTTEYGDTRTKLVVFRARAQQKSAHNEFLATGGSLYFTKHKDVIVGSDKVKIEVRDKITGLVVSSKEMVEGADYEMDYDSGRILFWLPVPMLVDTYSIISNKLLDGNLVYVVADYEYDVKEDFDQATVGFRARQAIGDRLLVGGTYVKEDQDNTDYTLAGLDVTARINQDASVTAEVAQTSSETQGIFISTDGGLSFTEFSDADDAQGRAFGITGDARLFNRLGAQSYYKWIDNNFSNAATTSQQGKETIGVALTYDFDDDSRLTFRHDIQNLVEDGNLQTQLQLGAYHTETTLVQIMHQARRFRLTGEIQRTVVNERLDQFDAQRTNEQMTLAARAEYDVSDKLTLSIEQQMDLLDEADKQTTLEALFRPIEDVEISITEGFGDQGIISGVGIKADVGGRMDGLVEVSGDYAFVREKDGTLGSITSVGAKTKLGDKAELGAVVGRTVSGADETRSLTLSGSASPFEGTELTSSMEVAQAAAGETKTLTFGGTSTLDGKTVVESSLSLVESPEDQSQVLAIGGSSQVDANTVTTGKLELIDTLAEGQSRAYTFGTRTQLNKELELAIDRTFSLADDSNNISSIYSLTRTKDGKALTGSLERALKTGTEEVSRANIYGLTGEIDDRWALSLGYESGDVDNLDGTQTARDVFTFGAGFLKKDEETAEELLKASFKAEARYDEGEEDKRQYLVYGAVEGQIMQGLTAFAKIEFSQTRNLTTIATEAQHREIVLGGAYRPIYYDRLNLLARYSYLEGQSPASQLDEAEVEEERTQVLSAEAIYDLNEHWQISEKFAYRILDEKVRGFAFNRTHTWLMIHRLNYKIDQDWSIGGEFRTLTVEEAEDVRRGFLIEGTRRVGEFAQLGVGYNFTKFSDDLTELDYTSQGPFMRMTGKFYDRTEEEIARSKERWLSAKISNWAWIMIQEELSRENSPILGEFNDYFFLAQLAYEDGRIEESQQIYKDIIIAGQMMHEEAVSFIREHIAQEEKWQDMQRQADVYYKNGEYEKAKKILQKIIEEVQSAVIE